MQGADNGLNGVNVSWNFPDMSSLNGQGRIPAFRTTQEQLASFVPYVEYVYNGSNVTGLKWRVVKASDTATPVAQDFRMRFRVMNVYKESYVNFYSGSWIDIASGNVPEGTITFDAPIAASEIWGIRVRLYTHWEEDSPERYEWRFFTASTSAPEIWMNHVSRASIVNGKSDYSDAQFLGLFMDYADYGTMAEAKYFTGDGRLNIPGGGYTLRAKNESNDLLGTIEAGRDMSFRLKMTEGINSEYLYYQPIDSTGEYIGFGDGAETGLNGKTVTFTFPSELNMNISRIVPNFKSVSQQLAECVPYIELVTEGGNITSIDFCLVSARDTSTVVELPYRTELHFTVYHSSGNDNYGFTAYTDGWLNLDNPLPMSDLRYVRVRLYTYEDSSNPCVYQWNFYPSTASGGVSSSGGGGGGCNGLAGIAAIASLAYIISQRH